MLLSHFRKKPPSSDVDAAVEDTFRGSSSESVALRNKWRDLLSRLSRFEKCSSGNRVTVLETGAEAVPAMLEAIRAAQSRVWLETYIFDSSSVSRAFIDELLAAADRGCDVVVLVDYCGGLDFPWRPELEKHGKIDFVVFNSPFFSSDKCVGPINFRDHRKILIADSVGFVGSMNIHRETCGIFDAKLPTFYDVHVKLEGPSVAHLAEVFADSLEVSESGSVVRSPSDVSGQIDQIADGAYVQIFESNVKREKRSLQRALGLLIGAADKSVLLASSYFMPPGFLKRALLGAARKEGVQLEMLLSGDSDFWPIPGDLLAQTHAVRRFVADKQVKVHLYSQEHMHAKYTCVDGVYSLFGSFNFDRWSARRNLEVAVGVFDRKVANRVEEIFESRKAQATQMDKNDWYLNHWGSRAICAVAYFVLKLSGKNIVDGMDSYRRDWATAKRKMIKSIDDDFALHIAIGGL